MQLIMKKQIRLKACKYTTNNVDQSINQSMSSSDTHFKDNWNVIDYT